MQPQIEKLLIDFFSKYRVFKYKKGEIIARPGDQFSQILFTKSGYVRLYTVSVSGNQQTVNFFKPTFYLSLHSALQNKTSRYYFECVTPVEIWKAPIKDFVDFSKADTNVLEALNTTLLNVLEGTIYDIGNIIPGTSHRKVAAIIYSLARQSGKKISPHKVLIDLIATHEVLASLTGLTRETTTIQIRKLIEAKIIIQENRRLIIINMTKLEAIAQS